MKWIKTIAFEGYGLFVDDGTFAIGILSWVAVTWLLQRASIVPSYWCGMVLVLGLALILAASVGHRARRRPND